MEKPFGTVHGAPRRARLAASARAWGINEREAFSWGKCEAAHSGRAGSGGVVRRLTSPFYQHDSFARWSLGPPRDTELEAWGPVPNGSRSSGELFAE